MKKKMNNGGKRSLWSLLGYLFIVRTYKFEITATVLITDILVICRVQFMEVGGVRK
jgi:hypothetical protein